MKISPMMLLTLAALVAATSPQSASAQIHHRSVRRNIRHNAYTPRYNLGGHRFGSVGRHAIRDAHGFTIGIYNRGVVHQNSTYIVPHTTRAVHHGTYYVSNNSYYYTPRTASIDPGHHAQQPAQVPFGGFTHVEDLAGRLDQQANEFLLDLYHNYSHNHDFKKVYAEGYQLLQVAKFMHAAEHVNDRAAIQSKLNGMESLFHHVQDEVRGWRRDHHRQVGTLGILSKMDMIESTLHHLLNDAGVRQAPVPAAGGLAPPPGGIGQAPPPGARAPAPGGFAPASSVGPPPPNSPIGPAPPRQ